MSDLGHYKLECDRDGRLEAVECFCPHSHDHNAAGDRVVFHGREDDDD